LFVTVTNTGSFSKAARAAGVAQPTASKQIASLETRLGAQLLRRTSRGLSLTGAGQAYYESAVRLLGDFEAADAQIGKGQVSPSGLVRAAMSAGFGRMYVIPRLTEFFARFPEVTIDLDISERYVNLIEEGIDVAIRMGHLTDSTLVAQRVGTMDVVTVASPEYIARHGEPATPDDLASHASVAFMSRGAPWTWEFNRPSGVGVFVPKGPFRTNDAEHLRAAVIAGIGIGHSASWLFAGDLATGMVKRLLEKFDPVPYPISAVSPSGRRLTNRARVFIDFLAQICADEPTLRIR
jgi:LysR family transcriptional regulator for bpeEF and oprC